MFHSTRAHGRPSAARVIATMALTISFVITGAGTVNAQSADGEAIATTAQSAQGTHGGPPKKKALVGSWLDTVTFPPESGRPPLKSLVSYHDDQIMTYSDQGTVTTEPPTVFSSGRGVWKHLEERTFGYTAFGLISDLSGNLVGYLKTRGIYTLSQPGDKYHGTTFAEVLDIEGNVLFSVEVTNTGQRIQFELP